MEDAVFVLGAGASAPFGVPTLLRVFLDEAAKQHLRGDTFLHEKLNELFWKPRGHTLRTSHRSISVEEILTLVRDYENQAYSAPPLLGDDTERFRRSLYVLIKKAVYDGKHSRGKFLNPVIEFAEKTFKHVTWATFNWDCIFEASFYYSSSDNPYWRSNPKIVVDLRNWRNTDGKHVLLKLHGGINWWYENKRIHYLPFGSQPDLNSRWRRYEAGKAKGDPVILEPSYYKYEDPVYQHLKPQWDYFVKHLLSADVVIVVGYSLPEADIEARRALSIGFQSNPKARFFVIDRSDWVCDRYERLFGSNRLKCVRKGLEAVYKQFPDIIFGDSLS